MAVTGIQARSFAEGARATSSIILSQQIDGSTAWAKAVIRTAGRSRQNSARRIDCA